MKASIKVILTAVTAVALCFAAPVLATDFVWEGNVDDSWINEDNWDLGDGFPQGDGKATIMDPSLEPMCVLDYTDNPTLSIRYLVLGGDPPTKMELNVADCALDIDIATTLNTYALLDADDDFDSLDTVMSGNIWIEVASGQGVDLGDADVQGTALTSSGISCTVTLDDTSGAGTLTADEVTIRANQQMGISRGLKLSGGGTFKITDQLLLVSQTDYRATLWVENGTIDLVSNGGTGALNITGGPSTASRASLDIDDLVKAVSTTFDGSASSDGYVTVDVRSPVTMFGGDVTFGKDVVVTKTGAGTFKSGS